MSLKSLGRKLSLKYADNVAPTLREGAPMVDAEIPTVREKDEVDIPLPKLDVNERQLHLLPKSKATLLKVLDLMYLSNMVTSIYYQHARKHLYLTTDTTHVFKDFIKIIEDAEKELITYKRRLDTAKELLAK